MELNLFFVAAFHRKASDNLPQPIILWAEMPGHHAGGNPSQRRMLKMKLTRVNHQCSKRFCLLRAKPMMSAVPWDLLINSQHRHAGTLFAALPGMDSIMFSCQELQVSTAEGHLQISPPYLTSVFSALTPRPLLKPTFLGGPEP